MMADSFAAGIKDDGIASSIADDRTMASVQDESLPLVLSDKFSDRLTHLGRRALTLFVLHVTPG